MVMSIAVMAVAGWAGRPSSRLRYREVAHLTLRALNRGRRAGSRVARTARPMAPGRSAGLSGQIPAAAVSWSLAASIAVVKLARSGSVPGRVSTAVTMAIRSSWYRVSRAQSLLLHAGPVTRAQHLAVQQGVPQRQYADSISQRS